MKIKKNNQLIQFDSIQVNVIENVSGIFVGTNYQTNWASSNKTNSALGGISGDYNQVFSNLNVLYDNDGIDTLLNGRGKE